MKEPVDHLGHIHERVNMIYTYAGDEPQRAASPAVWQTFQMSAQTRTEHKPASPKVAEGNREEVNNELSD
jgi:hypothetical protein